MAERSGCWIAIPAVSSALGTIRLGWIGRMRFRYRSRCLFMKGVRPVAPLPISSIIFCRIASESGGIWRNGSAHAASMFLICSMRSGETAPARFGSFPKDRTLATPSLSRESRFLTPTSKISSAVSDGLHSVPERKGAFAFQSRGHRTKPLCFAAKASGRYPMARRRPRTY